MSMAFYARDSQIVILELGDYKSQIGMADYLKLPQITALTPSTKQLPTLATKKQLLLSLFKKYDIKIDRNDFPVLLLTKTETKAELENTIQIMFETLNVPGLYLLDTSLACLYACGLITGLVVDIGYNSTRVCPVLENGVNRSAIVEVNVGGKDVDEILLKSLKLTDPVELLKLKQAVVICAGSKQEAEQTKPVDYNGKQIGNIRAKCVEVLFDPSINNKHILSVQQAISHSIKQACEPPKRVSLWENIILTGGSSEISGLSF